MLSHFLGHLQRATATGWRHKRAESKLYCQRVCDLQSPHVEELLADLLVLLLHAQLSAFALRGQLGEQVVPVFFEKTHPAQVLHTLAGRGITQNLTFHESVTIVQHWFSGLISIVRTLSYDLENVL